MTKQISEMTDEEHAAFIAELASQRPEPMPPTILKNGSRYEVDRSLGATVEVTPEGRRFIVKLTAEGLVRAQEQRSENAQAASVASGGSKRVR
ncbi:MAG: hypothetical protein U0Q16_02880 [Bryobacteraceae bacterium]